MKQRILFYFKLVFYLFFIITKASHASEFFDATKLAETAQNRLAKMMNISFQDNINFGMGDFSKTGSTLNIIPLIPINLTKNWYLISRSVIPLTYLPKISDKSASCWGLSDFVTQFYFSTVTGILNWGIGPQLAFPTASHKSIGSGKYSAGPAFIALYTSSPWVNGIMINNMWSFAGGEDRRKVDIMSIQPTINYNLANGWYLTSAPQIYADWAASKNSNTWVFPVGAGIGKVVKIKKQPINLQATAYYNALRPEGAAKWQLRLQLQFLFPNKAAFKL